MSIIFAVSTTADGSMLTRGDEFNQAIINNRIAFLSNYKITVDQTTRVHVVYEGDNYRRYVEVSDDQKGNGMFDDNVITADALITHVPGHALFLPLADCIGIAVYDPNNHILMVSHLGRHSIEQNGGQTSIKFLADHYKCNPSDLRIFVSPAAGGSSYPLFSFGGRSLKNVLFEQLKSAGVRTSNIIDNTADTALDSNYFSHSQYLAGARDSDGRFAIVAMMNDEV